MLEIDTHWSLVFRYNAIFYTVVTGMVICSCMGLVYSKIFNATLNCLILAMFAHVVGIVLAGVYLFKASGAKCAEQAVAYDDLGNSFKSDANMLRQLFIAQVSLFVPFSLCACFGMQTGKQLRKKHTDDEFARQY